MQASSHLVGIVGIGTLKSRLLGGFDLVEPASPMTFFLTWPKKTDAEFAFLKPTSRAANRHRQEPSASASQEMHISANKVVLERAFCSGIYVLSDRMQR